MSEKIKFSDDADKNSVEVAIPKEQRILQTQAYDKSVSDVIAMLNSGDIILNPEYQRNYVWNNKKASLLIESILLNVPIPIIYVSEEEDSKWSVVDGLQRLYSLKRYFNNEFKLNGLEVLQELNRSSYHTLNPKAQRILRSGNLRMILIFKESNPEIKYDIFMRLNRGSIQLNEQELRNCLYRGGFNELLKKMAQNDNLLEILRLKKPHRRMRDAEMVLRYFAFSDNFKLEQEKMLDYKGSMRTFLNIFIKSKQKINDTSLTDYETNFNETMRKTVAVFGNNAFRRIDVDGNYDKAVNRAIADFIMVSFEKFDYELLSSKKDLIIELLRELPREDERFQDSITIGTSDTARVEYRLTTWIKKLNSLLRT